MVRIRGLVRRKNWIRDRGRDRAGAGALPGIIVGAGSGKVRRVSKNNLMRQKQGQERQL